MVYSIPVKRSEHAQSIKTGFCILPCGSYGRAPFKALRWVKLVVSFFWKWRDSSTLESPPPERLPRRAARGLGARSPHQHGSFPSAFMRS